MSILFFEGFETIGTEVGFENRSEPTARLQKRMALNNAPGPQNQMFLTDSADGNGFAWHMGQQLGSQSNTLEILLPEEYQVLTGRDAPVMTLGALVHIPLAERTFDLFTLQHTGAFDPNLQVRSSRDLRIQVSASYILQADDVLVPGSFHYIEWRTRADGTLGQSGEAVLASQPEDDAEEISLSDVEINLPAWESSDFYGPDDKVRHRGIAYLCLETSVQDEPGTVAGEEYWSELGDAESFTESVVPFGSQFFFDGYPELIYTVNTFNNTSTVGFTPKIDVQDFYPEYDPETDNPEDYIPDADTDVFFGPTGLFDVYVDGTKVMDNYGVRTMGAGNQFTLDKYVIKGASSADPEGGDYVAVDNIYLIVEDGSGAVDPLGPVNVVSMPPNADDTAEWDPSQELAPHYSLIDENGVSKTDYVSSQDNDNVDVFDHTAAGINGNLVYATKLEAEVENVTAGTPSLILTINSGSNSDTLEQQFENTGDSTVMSLITESDPDGGAWDEDALDAATIEIEMSNNLT